MTRIAIVGAGRIGGNLARLFAGAGHDVTVSFARDQDKLEELAKQIGAAAGDPARAVAQAEVVVISVPWAVVDAAIEQAGGPGALAGKLLYGEEFHHDDAVAAVARLRGTPPSGRGRP